MKHLPKSTPTEILNDPYGFTYKEMSEVIGENEAKALYSELYKQAPRKKNLSMLVKDIYKSSDTEKYVYELKDRYGTFLLSQSLPPFIEFCSDYRNICFDIRINKDMYAFENCFYSIGILRFRFGCLKREFYKFYISLLA